ncbi:MAG: CDP-alcohol phosphatidyltransferase family protein [Acidimicrobiales bacterium]
MSGEFAGDKKLGQSLLGPAERRFIDWGVPKIPKAVLSHHLTFVTIAWSAGTILFGWLATDNRIWLHAMSIMVFGQWLTDSFDGSLGKFRKQGLVKWGFFMDHLLDLVFAGSIVIGYSFLVQAKWLEFLFLILLLTTCATMAVSFLAFAATNQFQIAYYGIGPTEIRIGYIALNSFVYFAGTDLFSWGVPVIVALNVAAFAVMVIQTSRNLWRIDYHANVDNAPRTSDDGASR